MIESFTDNNISILKKEIERARRETKHVQAKYACSEYIIILIVGTIFSLLLGYLILRRSKHRKRRRVYFVGPRKSGKTTAIYKLLHNTDSEDPGKTVKTVPTLETHTTTINGLEVVEQVPNEQDEPIEKFNINSRDKYFFFLKNEDESYPSLAGFDVNFVYWRKVSNKKRSDIVYLDEDASNLAKLIYE